MKAVYYSHNVSTDHRNHHCNGAMPDESMCEREWRDWMRLLKLGVEGLPLLKMVMKNSDNSAAWSNQSQVLRHEMKD